MNEKSYQHISDIFTSKESSWQLISHSKGANQGVDHIEKAALQ